MAFKCCSEHQGGARMIVRFLEILWVDGLFRKFMKGRGITARTGYCLSTRLVGINQGAAMFKQMEVMHPKHSVDFIVVPKR